MTARPRAAEPGRDLDALAVELEARGWVTLTGVLDAPEAAALAARCDEALARLAATDRGTGDKPGSGTRRLAGLARRLPEAAAVLARPPVPELVATLLGDDHRLEEIAFRSPSPGFGEQRFHADAVPLRTPGPWTVATAIVALTELTPENGATGVIPGSHRRPDLQRASGNLEHHPDQTILSGPAGTVFLLCGHLLHRGRRNGADRARPVLQATWRREGRQEEQGTGAPAEPPASRS